MPQNQQLSIEDTLAELEALVDTLEQGDLPLDDSIRRFDRSLSIARASQDSVSLDQAEPLTVPFENYESDPDQSLGEHG